MLKYMQQKNFPQFWKRVFIYQTFFSYVKALPAIFLVTVVSIRPPRTVVFVCGGPALYFASSCSILDISHFCPKTKYRHLRNKNKVSFSIKMKKNVVRFQTSIDRQPRNSQRTAYLSRYKTQKPIVMAQVVALIGLEKFSRSVHLLQ